MEHQHIISFLNNTPNQRSKGRARNWDEINDDTHEMYNTNS